MSCEGATLCRFWVRSTVIDIDVVEGEVGERRVGEGRWGEGTAGEGRVWEVRGKSEEVLSAVSASI